MIYKIYAFGLHGYELIRKTSEEEKINMILDSLNKSIYSKALVIQYDKERNMDSVYEFIDYTLIDSQSLKRIRR